MEKIQNIFNKKVGIVLFYVIVALLSLLLTRSISNVNSTSSNQVEREVTYYA